MRNGFARTNLELSSKSAENLFNKFYPEMVADPFSRIVLQHLKGDCRIVDAGYGDGRIFKYDFKSRVEFLLGIDARNDLSRNQQVHYAAQALLENMPVLSNSIDLIFSRFVLEHVRFPQSAFLEFGRVLRPTGKLFIQVPNAYHYFVLANRVIPHKMIQWLASLDGYREEDAFPTFYRANTARTLKNLGENAGLRMHRVILYEPSPWFLRFSPITLAFGILYERIVNRFKVLSPFRAHINAIFQKD